MAKMRRGALAALVASGLILVGCSNGEEASTASSTSSSAADSSDVKATAQTVTIEDNHGTQEVPVNPDPVVSLDNRTFEVLADWGVELAAAPVNLIPSTITAYTEDTTANIGNHREPNLELVVAAQPEVIVQGQRFTDYYDELKQLVPDATIIDFEVRDGESLDKELIRQVEALGKVFDKEAEAKELVDEFNAALERAREAYDPEKSVMAVNVTGGDINYIAPGKGRTFGPLFDLVTMKPALEVGDSTSNHKGDDISVEAIAESNPDAILVLDRDGAVAADEEGYTPAEEVIRNNPALQNVAAIKDGKVYVAPADTYTNESIITYTEILNGMADLFESMK